MPDVPPPPPVRGVAPVPGMVVNPHTTVYRGGGEQLPAPGPAPGPPSGPAPEPASTAPEETSGSLTGFILSGGRADRPGSRTRLVVVGVVILAIVAALAGLGVVVVGTVLDRLLGG